MAGLLSSYPPAVIRPLLQDALFHLQNLLTLPHPSSSPLLDRSRLAHCVSLPHIYCVVIVASALNSAISSSTHSDGAPDDGRLLTPAMLLATAHMHKALLPPLLFEEIVKGFAERIVSP